MERAPSGFFRIDQEYMKMFFNLRMLIAIVCICVFPLLSNAQPTQGSLSEIDLRFSEAVTSDPKYFRGDINDPLRPTREDAINAWESFLQHDDLPREYEFIANWRLAAFHLYSMDPSKGDRPSYQKGEAYLDKALKVIPDDVVSTETVFAWSLWGNSIHSLPLSEGLDRQAKAYRWLRGITPDQLSQAAQNTNGHGTLIPDDIRSYPKYDPDSCFKLIEKHKTDAIQGHERHITDLIQIASPDELTNYIKLVDDIEDVAPPALVEKWRKALAKRLGDNKKFIDQGIGHALDVKTITEPSSTEATSPPNHKQTKLAHPLTSTAAQANQKQGLPWEMIVVGATILVLVIAIVLYLQKRHRNQAE